MVRVEELVASTEVIRTLAAADESSGSALAEASSDPVKAPYRRVKERDHGEDP